MPGSSSVPHATSNTHTCIQCQICQRSGHSAIDFFQRLNMSYIGRQPANKLIAMVASKNATSNDSLWYTDTGASHHTTSDLGNLQISSPYNGSDSVQLGNGDMLSISNIGSLSCSIGGPHFSMNHVLHCPRPSFNLLSVKRFAQDNYCLFQFDENGFIIKDKTTGRILHQGQADGDMYPMNFTTTHSSKPIPKAFISSSESTRLWHNRLGHPSINILSTPNTLLQLC